MEASLYDLFYQQETTHWWFQARKEIILVLVEKYLGGKSDLKILDIGCGTGMTMQALERFGEVWGIDKDEKAISYCKQRGLKNLLQADFPNAPLPTGLKEKFDLITFLDVIEHMPNDTQALEKAKTLLKPGGFMIISVPAFMFLWSPHDRANQHLRRYLKKELREKAQKAGFKILKLSYYNFFLFLPAFIKKTIDRAKYKDAPRSHEEDKHSRVMNKIYKNIFGLEKYFLKYISFPFGVSLIGVLKNE